MNDFQKPTLIQDLGMVEHGKNKTKIRLGVYKCFCGNIFTTRVSRINSGDTKSCGCYKKIIAKQTQLKNFSKHNMTNSKIYGVWEGMKQRCLNDKSTHYSYYGGRGITICDEWVNNSSSFLIWAMNNGYQEGLSIDRINSDGNYEPSNCRWATRTTQVENTRQLWKHNKSGYRNVYWHKAAKKWDVNFCINGKTTHIGMFINIEDAILYRNNFIIENNMATPLIKF